MAYMITDDCTMCGACQPECPENCINEGDPKYTIESEKCTDCASCAAVCPTGACVPS